MLRILPRLRVPSTTTSILYRNGTTTTRSFASATSQFTTQTTTLDNGLTIASEYSPFAQTATVGVYIDAGSRVETAQTNGTAHFLEHLSFKGTKNASQTEIEHLIESTGSRLNAYTSREQTVFYAQSLSEHVPTTVKVLSDILSNSLLSEQAIERERDVILRESEEIDKLPEEVVFDHLHATAFQGSSLGYTILGPKENILKISKADLTNYIQSNYTADRMVLVGAGAIKHEDLVSLAEKHFAHFKGSKSHRTIGAPKSSPPEFVGSEVRYRDDTLPAAYIAIAVEGVSWNDPDYFTLLVMQAIIGKWDRMQGNTRHLSSKLSSIVQQNGLAKSFMSFNTSYSDTGLWGIYLVTDNYTRIDDLVHFTLKEWSRLSISVTDAEVERAKAQLKGQLILSLDSTAEVAEDIGRQIVTSGRRLSPAEIDEEISKVTADEVMRVARDKLWDQDIAIAAYGQTEGLLDYNRVRAGMSMLRW